jgi:hypothetical protein
VRRGLARFRAMASGAARICEGFTQYWLRQSGLTIGSAAMLATGMREQEQQGVAGVKAHGVLPWWSHRVLRITIGGPDIPMNTRRAPYHAHIYFDPVDRPAADALHRQFSSGPGGRRARRRHLRGRDARPQRGPLIPSRNSRCISTKTRCPRSCR